MVEAIRARSTTLKGWTFDRWLEVLDTLLGLADQIHHPAFLVPLTLPAVALIDMKHLAEELTFGPALFLR
jgi:hypothetical protein